MKTTFPATSGAQALVAPRIHRNHAIFGWSDACVATHPSDVAVAFAAMDANVVVRGRAGERSIPFVNFHRLPETTPERDNVLDRGDLIVAIEVPARAEARASYYLKVRDRQSYEFALVSAAAAVSTDGRRIRSARAVRPLWRYRQTRRFCWSRSFSYPFVRSGWITSQGR
jgi:CO/xanthine dehydrogenase FAD-binding subunit